MARRYGRNQKRAHRERIAALEAEAALLQRTAGRAKDEAMSARRALSEAKASALTEWLNRADEIRYYRDRIADEIGRHMAPELERHARTVLEAGRGRGALPELDAYSSPSLAMAEATVLRGEMPGFRYKIQVI